MTPVLRRNHRLIWLVLAVVLPIGFCAAILLNKKPIMQNPPGSALPAALPVFVRSVITPDMQLTLRRSIQLTDYQLDILVTKSLDVPSAVVRVRQRNDWRAVGLLNAPGQYRFRLPDSTIHPLIEIIDDIHQRGLRTVQF